jgi:hypothetical protein
MSAVLIRFGAAMMKIGFSVKIRFDIVGAFVMKVGIAVMIAVMIKFCFIVM